MADNGSAVHAARSVRLFEDAMARHRAGDLAGAVAGYRAVHEISPDHAPSWANLGIALKLLGDIPGAVDASRRAVFLDDRNANAFNNLGIALMAAQRTGDALDAYRNALAIDPRFHECWCNLGLALASAGEPAQAADAFLHTLSIDPNYTEALVHLVHQNLQQCAWRKLDQWVAQLAKVVRDDAGEVNPFVLLAICREPSELQGAARNFARDVERSVAHLSRPQRNRRHRRAADRLRIGYLSGDLHAHATAYLAAELFESHDRSRFDVTAYSFGPDDHSSTRERLRRAFERFVDIAPLSTAEAAQTIASDEIDILVDLKGYTQGARTGILALRPAPIQVAYLGYPGTMGARFIDYAIVDRFIVPPNADRFFDEKLVFLPGSYQPNDSCRQIGDAGRARAEHGLPLRGFVFCCFNQLCKITPEVFALWMELLRRIPESVMWLLAFNHDGPMNLRQEAIDRGIAAERLIFADKRPLGQHLARLRYADLFLDTWPCGAHTTASDALWAGVPVVTNCGTTFASRVAGSLLHALGLDDLITTDAKQYFALAFALATNAAMLESTKRRLATARQSSDLFSGAAAAKKLEAAYVAVWQRHAAGLGSENLHFPS